MFFLLSDLIGGEFLQISMVTRMMCPYGESPQRCPCVGTATPFPLQLYWEQLSSSLSSKAGRKEKTHITGEPTLKVKGQETQGTQREDKG